MNLIHTFSRISLICLGIVFINSCSFNKEEIDLIVFNGTIYTIDGTEQIASAMAIDDGEVVELGPDRQIQNKYIAKESLDLKKSPVYPGFIDAHCHFLGYGTTRKDLDVSGTSSWSEVVKMIAEHSREFPSGWITGRGWDQNDWRTKDYPTKFELDQLYPDRPVCVKRVDGHAALVNSKALELANITSETFVDGGEVIVDENGPTGILIDNAINLIENVIPDPDKEEKTRALKIAQKDCFEVGLTTVTDAGLEKEDIFLIEELHESGDLKMQICAMLSANQENFDYFLEKGPYSTDRLNVRAFKFYADGALGSRGACLLSPYSDAIHKDHLGFLLDSIENFRSHAQNMYDYGFQMNTHCIGDSANRLILDIYGSVLKGSNDLRWRIEHAQVVSKQDIEKFSKFSVIPSIQPTHATSDMYWAEMRLGRNRLRRAYAYKELKEQLGLVALGTDFPVEGINPINTFYAAVARKDVDGFPNNGYMMENALSREDALKGMTIWAAISNFEENEKGSLEPGKNADFVVLSQDILKVDDASLLKTDVIYTYIKGEQVYTNRED